MSIFKHHQLLFVFVAGFILLVVAGLLVIINFSGIDSPLIIHFDIFSGLNLIGSKVQIFTIVGIALVVNVINFILAVAVLKRQVFLSYVLGASITLVNLFVLIAIVVLININL